MYTLSLATVCLRVLVPILSFNLALLHADAGSLVVFGALKAVPVARRDGKCSLPQKDTEKVEFGGIPLGNLDEMVLSVISEAGKAFLFLHLRFRAVVMRVISWVAWALAALASAL